MTTCHDAAPLLPLIADGTLGPEDDPALFAHLADCTHCQEVLAAHDLVTLALETTAAPRQRHRHPLERWWAIVPLAAAAGFAAVLSLRPANAPAGAPAIAGDRPETTAAQASAVAAATAPTPARDLPAALPALERDVAAVQGGGRRLILVRRGDQVLLIDPAAPAAPEPDRVPTGFHY
jgi:hypothetical protein